MKWEMRTAYVQVKTAPGKAPAIFERVKNWPHAIGAWVVDGEWDLLVWFDVKDWRELHQWIGEMRAWEGVAYTSSHWVYEGGKSDDWWWKQKAGAWVWARSSGKPADQDSVKQYPWLTSWASTPGEWDMVAWVGGDSWDQVWEHAQKLKAEGWNTDLKVPLQSWWNKGWETRWWG
jgi:hypothetical protein